MKKLKILILYAGIGGNRKLWNGDITAIEIRRDIADEVRGTRSSACSFYIFN